MPKTSIADAIVAWETALTNAKANATDVPGIDGYIAPLEQMLADLKALSAGLVSQVAQKQQGSRDRRVLMQQGNIQVSRLRSAVRAFYGPHSERIIAFGGRPVRPKTNKAPVVPEEPPVVTPPGPEVAAGSGTPAPEVVKPAGKPEGKENEAPRNPTAA
jgi:hypothetical protein